MAVLSSSPVVEAPPTITLVTTATLRMVTIPIAKRGVASRLVPSLVIAMETTALVPLTLQQHRLHTGHHVPQIITTQGNGGRGDEGET